MIIAFEGLDQSGKQTQTAALIHTLHHAGYSADSYSFPAYQTYLGAEIAACNNGQRKYSPESLQLLYAANKLEFKDLITLTSQRGVAVCDRWIYSAVAYGSARGVNPDWLIEIQKYLPSADLTILLDIPVETSVERKRHGRDSFEADLQLLSKVRSHYQVVASLNPNWVKIDGTRTALEVHDDVWRAVEKILRPVGD